MLYHKFCYFLILFDYCLTSKDSVKNVFNVTKGKMQRVKGVSTKIKSGIIYIKNKMTPSQEKIAPLVHKMENRIEETAQVLEPVMKRYVTNPSQLIPGKGK